MTAPGLNPLPASARRARVTPPRSPRAIAALAVRCLDLEVDTFPKPGLVSRVDRGSHSDMDAGTFQRSAQAIQPHLVAMAVAGGAGAGMDRLRRIGLDAEAAMFAATNGVNTHRGAIFGMGLLCAAAGAKRCGQADDTATLGSVVTTLWGRDILSGAQLLRSHGADARRRYGAGGARMEAACGFPSAYEIGVPALRRGMRLAAGDAGAARVEACFALIAQLEDTNLLHRGGMEGLQFARDVALNFLQAGGVGGRSWRAHAKAAHKAFVDRRLSPGGSADLLAMSLFIDACETEPFQ